MSEYFSGLLDSDGWVGRRGRMVRCVIANTVKDPLILLQENFGGCLYSNTPRDPLKHRVLWYWEKSLRQDELIVFELLRYSLVKASNLGIDTSSFRVTNSYAAGLFDGDGTVTMSKRSKASKARGYQITAAIYNTEETLMKMLVKEFGGFIYRPPRKNVFNWIIGSKQVRLFLERIIPFLIIKKQRVELALQAVRVQSEGKVLAYGNKNARYILPDHIVAKVEGLKQEMLRLNERGVTEAA